MGLLVISKIIITIYKNEDFELFIPNSTKFLVIFWSLIAEELGWRGFFQEKVEQKIGIILNIFSLNINDSDGKYLTYMITTFSYGFCVIGFFIYYYWYKKHCNNKRNKKI